MPVVTSGAVAVTLVTVPPVVIGVQFRIEPFDVKTVLAAPTVVNPVPPLDTGTVVKEMLSAPSIWIGDEAV